jgi:hypothetical protein
MKQGGETSESATGHEANGSVAEAHANQIAYCRANDATITARVVSAVARLLDDSDAGAFLQCIRGWTGRPLTDALPLRSVGALHGLYLSGNAP